MNEEQIESFYEFGRAIGRMYEGILDETNSPVLAKLLVIEQIKAAMNGVNNTGGNGFKSIWFGDR